jgi:hypothetical protein
MGTYFASPDPIAFTILTPQQSHQAFQVWSQKVFAPQIHHYPLLAVAIFPIGLHQAQVLVLYAFTTAGLHYSQKHLCH